MNQINEITINGFFDNDNHQLVFSSQSNLISEIDEFVNYLDNLFLLSNQINKNFFSKKTTLNDTEKLIADLKMIYISKIVYNVLTTFIEFYNKSLKDGNLKEIDKQNILSQLWLKIQPELSDKVNNLSKWAYIFKRSVPYIDDTGKVIFTDPEESDEDEDIDISKINSDTLLEKIIKLKDVFQECVNQKEKIEDIIKKNPKYNDRQISKNSGAFLPFEDYNLPFINFRSELLSKEFNWPPIFKNEFKISMKTPDQQSATLFFLPNKIEISESCLENFLKDINLIYKLNKQLVYDEERKKLEILKLRSKTTDEYTKDALLAPEKEAIRKQAEYKFDTSKISKDINKIYEEAPSLRNLTDSEILLILENTLNIFIYPGQQLIKILRDYCKKKSKSSENVTDTPSNDTKFFENNIKLLITVLNKLKLKNIVWGDKDDKETYKFIPSFFLYKILNEIEKKKYILEVYLNLEYSVINTYLKFNIDFISNDPAIKNIKNYNFKVSDSIPDSKISEGYIYLPPLIYSNTNVDPKDIDCCYVLVTEDDIKTFNKKNPTVKDKEIFTNIGIIDNLVNQIAKKREDNEYRYKNKDAFEKDIKLISDIFFDPHPLTNKYIGFISKHFSKNNLIYYQGKPYHIINFKFGPKGIPSLDKFELNETKKDGKQQISKTYTIKIILTVANGEKPLTLSSSVAASCPEKADKLNQNYKNITDNIDILKNYGKPNKLKNRWHLKDGVLQKANVSDIQKAGKKTKKKSKYNYMNKKKFTKNKFRKLNKKTKKRERKRKYTRRKMKYAKGLDEKTSEKNPPKVEKKKSKDKVDQYGYRLDSEGWHADSEFQCFGCESGTDFGYHCPACERETDLRHRR